MEKINPAPMNAEQKERIEKEANWRFTTGHGATDHYLVDIFKDGADFGYSLASKEIEELSQKAAELHSLRMSLLESRLKLYLGSRSDRSFHDRVLFAVDFLAEQMDQLSHYKQLAEAQEKVIECYSSLPDSFINDIERIQWINRLIQTKKELSELKTNTKQND